METSSIREEARFHLQGRWGMAILVTFLASVLGGLILNGGSANFDFDEDTLRRLPEVVRSYLLIAASFGATLGVIQFVIGGTIRLGYCKFLLNLHDGGNADIKDLFCLQLSFIGWAILSALTLGIGNFWLNPYMNMSYAVFYRRLQEPVYPVSEPVIDPSMI